MNYDAGGLGKLIINSLRKKGTHLIIGGRLKPSQTLPADIINYCTSSSSTRSGRLCEHQLSNSKLCKKKYIRSHNTE